MGVHGTGYGRLLLGKTAGLLALGGFGWWHRRRTLPGVRAGSPGSFRRFAVIEAGVMLATMALAVALSASPPPASADSAAPQSAAAEPAEQLEPAEPVEPDPMAGHDHGELSVAVLIDGTRFHVAGPVDAGSRVTVHNSSDVEVTITADDGAFDVVVPSKALITFAAPAEPGEYSFTSGALRRVRGRPGRRVTQRGLVPAGPRGQAWRTGWLASRRCTVKELKCRDAGFDCDAVVHGQTEDEVMAQAGPHARDAHGVEVTPEMAGQIRTLVHDA